MKKFQQGKVQHEKNKTRKKNNEKVLQHERVQPEKKNCSMK